MIVVDSKVIAHLYLPGEHSDAAEALLMHDSSWAAPLPWRSEMRNVLAGYLRRKLLSFEQARAVQSEAERLLAGSEYEVDSSQVLELVQCSPYSAYDCEFAALAKALSVPLVTMDRKLLPAFPEHTRALSGFFGAGD